MIARDKPSHLIVSFSSWISTKIRLSVDHPTLKKYAGGMCGMTSFLEKL